MASQSVIDAFEEKLPTVEFNGRLGFLSPKTGIEIYSAGDTAEDGSGTTFIPFDILTDNDVLEIVNDKDAMHIERGVVINPWGAEGKGGFKGKVVKKSIVNPVDEDFLLREVFVSEKSYKNVYRDEVKDFLIKKWEILQRRIDDITVEFIDGFYYELKDTGLNVYDLQKAYDR